MHGRATVAKALRLKEAGLNHCEISRRTGVSRPTIREWCSGRLPHSLLLRVLIQSDGCRFINTGSGGWRAPRYSFSNLSIDIKQIFCEACDQLDLH
jgi:transcriptional regulator with XRE-family HTH domain